MFIIWAIKINSQDLRTSKGIRNIINMSWENKEECQKCADKIKRYYECCHSVHNAKEIDALLDEIEEIYVTNLNKKGKSSNLQCNYDYFIKVREKISEKNVKEKQIINNGQNIISIIGIILATLVGVVQILIQLWK